MLVVEDDAALARWIGDYLVAHGLRASVATRGDVALELIGSDRPDAVVLDLGLPVLDGLAVCRRARAFYEGPILMLTARDDDEDEIRGLETGADDYVIKPYSVIELMARIRTQLRRSRPAAVGERLEFDDIRADTEEHRVYRGEHELHLGPTEFRLLCTFMERPGRVWSRDQLLDRVWGRDIYVDSRTVDVHVGRLRKALRGATGTDDPIRTVRGAGYALG